jgi:uncharacterized protein DUF4920
MNVGDSRWSMATDFWRSMPVPRAVWVAVCVGLGCESGLVQPPPPERPAVPAVAAAASHDTPQPAPSGAVGRFGAPFEPGAAVPLASILSEPRAFADKTITTEGRVQRACSRKGCWMEIGSGEDSCRITFKDYGFFVPTDSAGAFAKVQGRLDTREVEAAAVEHLESEGAHFRNKRSDGSATEVRMIASAVELRR